MKTILALEPSEARSSLSAAVGEIQGDRRATEISPTAEPTAGNAPKGAPDPEVPEKIPNRFKYKLPVPDTLTTEVWINPPSTENVGV